MTQENQTNVFLPFTGIAQWLIAIGAFIYTTGFLVALNFMDFIGAREATTDLFRAKYVLMGILCLVFPIIIIGCFYAILELKDHKGSSTDRLYNSSIVLIFNLLLTFYFFIMFAPQGYLRNRPQLIWLILIVTIVGVLIINKLAIIIRADRLPQYHNVGRWILCILSICILDPYCFWGIKERLLEIFWPHGIWFFIFATSIAYIILRLMKRAMHYTDTHSKMAFWILGWCVIGLLYFLMVYAFSYGIYPQIAANRGGGDFTETPRILLYYTDSGMNYLPKDIKEYSQSQELILIDESEQIVLVADPMDSGGPTEWRKGHSNPKIYAINRSLISAVTYLDRKNPPIESIPIK